MKALLASSLLLAGVVLAGTESEIIRLIEEVKRAHPEERYKVMNELKLRLRELNRREREEMIRKIYEELKGERAEHHEREEHYEREEHHEHREEIEEDHEERYERYEEKHRFRHEEREIEKGEDRSGYMDDDAYEEYHHDDD
ncbi:MAG TPA: hypothetical protein ENJ61_07445 [Aquifex aeolicus]|uniref:Uncharacterized protein n=1 Tax=Aquifex aeolicus TaxID=63363 RepID=A0A7C5L5S1_AQUAO|nr:hypothetical protein [Aquifex aeolicus]